ncbi:hypothetical protein DCC39_02260 [Pueribacillus theae]|uniref:HTH cro/C1-type domain-containing protein n=1 Tax=Pueribacillus theae TaxID=2171751 RepID=A0A2U1K6X8_9BACI|nr:S24 family peptidase [Pueribacillus theae]PWA13287.1 hypothetical protein DCC39_02260 [Pueribacillus theae]
MENVLGTFLEAVRKEKNLSLREAASKSGLGHSYIRDLELGINRKTGKKVIPSINSLKKIADAYELNIYDLLDKAGLIDLEALRETNESTRSSLEKQNNQSSPSPIPLLYEVKPHIELLNAANIEKYIYYPFSDGTQPDYALKMKGDSMARAGIDDGDIIYMRSLDHPEYNGQIAAVSITGNEEGMIKRITWSSNFPMFSLVSENPNYRTINVPFNKAEICGVYFGHFKPEKL